MSAEIKGSLTYICRVCMRNDRILCCMHDVYEVHQDIPSSKLNAGDYSEKLNLAEMLSECIKYTVKKNDGLPEHICVTCKLSLLNAWRLKREAEHSFRELLKIIAADKNIQSESTENLVATGEAADLSALSEASANHITTRKEQGDARSIIISALASLRCHICTRKFSNTNNLMNHFEVMHKIKVLIPCNSSAQKPLLASNVNTMMKIPLLEHVNSVPVSQNDTHINTGKVVAVHTNANNNHDADQDIDSNVDVDTHSDSDIDKVILEVPKLTGNVKETLCSKSTVTLVPEAKEVEHSTDSIDVLTKPLEPKKIQSASETLLNVAQASNSSSATTNNELTIKPVRSQLYKCKFCTKIFLHRMALNRHIATHESRYECKQCHKIFVTKEELAAHIKTSGHDKPMLCPHCGLRCKTANLLSVHLRRHNGEKPFKCRFCEKAFPRMDDKNVHEKYHTDEKSHFCATCGKGFLRKYNLHIHERVHTGERPYKCPHCPQAFAQSNDLKLHIRRHTGERFVCDICKAGFLQHYQMVNHKYEQHGTEKKPKTRRLAKFKPPELQTQQIQKDLQNEEPKITCESNKKLTDANEIETEEFPQKETS